MKMNEKQGKNENYRLNLLKTLHHHAAGVWENMQDKEKTCSGRGFARKEKRRL